MIKQLLKLVSSVFLLTCSLNAYGMEPLFPDVTRYVSQTDPEIGFFLEIKEKPGEVFVVVEKANIYLPFDYGRAFFISSSSLDGVYRPQELIDYCPRTRSLGDRILSYRFSVIWLSKKDVMEKLGSDEAYIRFLERADQHYRCLLRYRTPKLTV